MAFKSVDAQKQVMKIRQNLRHWAAKKALTTPVVGDIANDKLVDMHTKIFLEKADAAHREDRRAHLDGFFDATMDTYVAALQAGFTEAKAREITHIQANFDFFNHGWTEMMEIPGEEFEAHFRRYETFFKRHGISVDDPLGEFRPAGGIPSAHETPEQRDGPAYENAIAGFADDVYVEDDTGSVEAGGETDEPADVDPSEAPGVDKTDLADS
mgnify:CR=1 FL=1